METQCAVAEPAEGSSMTVHSSTQTLDGVQSAVARALGVPCHAVTACKQPPSLYLLFIFLQGCLENKTSA